MGRTKKEFNKDGIFQQRFREQYYKNFRTQKELADAIGVSRPTLAGWLDGKNIPDIISLKRMAELFDVSSDYLLGISDTERPDVNLRAAVEYTGLSEKAVEWIHNGLDDFVCDGVGLSDEEKNRNRNIASSIIVSENFTRMLHNISEVYNEAYWERIFKILDERYSEDDEQQEDDDFHFANDKDREICKFALSLFLKSNTPPEEDAFEEAEAMTDNEIFNSAYNILLEFSEQSELHQFHAAKAFTGFIDKIIKKSERDAERKVRDIENKVSNSKLVQKET